MWNQLVSEAVQYGKHPILFLTEKAETPKQKERQDMKYRDTDQENILR